MNRRTLLPPLLTLVVLVSGFLAPLSSSVRADGGPPSSVAFVVGRRDYSVDGQTLAMDAATFLENDRTYVPVRYLATALGVLPADIIWNGDTQQVSLRLGAVQVQFRVGSRELTVDGSVRQMDVAPVLREGRVYLPARWVAEALGYFVRWDAARSAVVITPFVSLRLATLSPLTGGAVLLGSHIKDGAALAVARFREQFRALGYNLSLAPYDDQGRPNVGVQAAGALLADPAVFGVVGTLNSGVARAVAPVLQSERLVLVSPSNTAPDLTASGWPHYNRLLATDLRQGPSGARFAARLRVGSAYLLHDGSTYGKSLVDGFAGAATGAGVEIAGQALLTARDANLEQRLAALLGTHPGLVFYGGLVEDAGPIFSRLRALGYAGQFMGGDGLDDTDLPKRAGDAAAGVYFVESTPRPLQADSPAVQQFAAAFRAQTNREPSDYAYGGYDAAGVILSATLQLLQADPGQAPGRAAVAAAVRATRGYQGLSGEVSFDTGGDNSAAVMWLFRFSDFPYVVKPVENLPAR